MFTSLNINMSLCDLVTLQTCVGENSNFGIALITYSKIIISRTTNYPPLFSSVSRNVDNLKLYMVGGPKVLL